jgi:hypothetical protein
MMEEVCLSRKFLRNFTYFIIVLCVKWPLAITSRHRLASMLRPKQKRCSNTRLGKDKSTLECIKTENLAQVAPIDSFSYCLKLRITFGRDDMRYMEECKTKLVFKFILIPIRTFYYLSVPLLHLLYERKGKQFPPYSFLCHARDAQAWTHFL